MGFETSRRREIKETSEKKTASWDSLSNIDYKKNIADLKKLVEGLEMKEPEQREVHKESGEIDQEWVRQNEAKEFSFAEPAPKDTESEKIEQMPGEVDIPAQEAEPTGPKPEEDIEPDPVESSPEASLELGEDDAPTVPEEDTELPSSPEKVRDEIEKLESLLDSKRDLLASEIAKLYNSEQLESETVELLSDIDNTMSDAEIGTLDALQDADEKMNSYISRLSKLVQKGIELKAKDDLRFENQMHFMRELSDFQRELEGKYGEHFFVGMDTAEKEKFVNLYSRAHEVSRERVEASIADSIKKANEEKKKQAERDQDEYQLKYADMISYYVRTSVDTLKKIHGSLGPETPPEKINSFNSLYAELSTASKIVPKNEIEEQAKLLKLQDIDFRIEQLQNE